MSAFSGAQALGVGAKGKNKGAQARRREQKQLEAEVRNELTPPERRRQARLKAASS